MKSSESNPPVKTKPREAEVGPEEEAFPEELMRLARPPKGITAEVKDGVLTIRRRWWTGIAKYTFYGCAGFAIFLNVFVLYIFGAWVVDSSIGTIGVVVSLLLAILVFWAPVWVIVMAHTMANAVNSSTIKVDQNSLSVTHGPVPTWFSGTFDVQIQTATVVQTYVRDWIISDENADTRIISAKVMARLHSGEHVVLFEGLTKPQAKFIEHRLEAFLGIANQRVAGEVKD